MKKKNTKSKSVLDFPLGNLKYFEGKHLFNDKDRINEDRVILGLAVAYNDLKSNLFLWEVLEENKPEASGEKISAKYGQHSGMMWISYKSITGIIHEVVKLVERNKRLFEKGIFKSTADKLRKNANTSWGNFWEFIFDQNPKSNKVNVELRKLLVDIRNNASFHYYQPKQLQSGYKKHFFKNNNAKAYFCNGSSMETTRFHFADAALEQYLMTSLNTFSRDHNKIFKRLFQLTHTSIYYFIEQYLEQIGAEITTLGNSNKLYEK